MMMMIIIIIIIITLPTAELHDSGATADRVGLWMEGATAIHKGETKDGGKLLAGG